MIVKPDRVKLDRDELWELQEAVGLPREWLRLLSVFRFNQEISRRTNKFLEIDPPPSGRVRKNQG
jgi:hypothetical protein